MVQPVLGSDQLFRDERSSAIRRFQPAVANSKDLINWLTLEGSGREINELLVWDAVFDKELGIKLWGGNIGWAGGVQARNEKYQTELSDVSNRAKDPCPWTNPYAVTLGFTTADQLSPNCTPKNGLVAFGVPGDNANTSRTVYAAFTELALPITDTINMQAAIRYEDYGSDVGSTVDPKVAIKWQALSWLALRGSYQTTFRGPPQSYLSGVNTYLQNIPAANAYRAVNIVGNPDLNPESADVFNTGIILEAGGFTGTIDYWNFDFKDPFQIESAGQLLTAYTANGCFFGGAGAPNTSVGTPNAGPITPVCQDLRPHVEPLGNDRREPVRGQHQHHQRQQDQYERRRYDRAVRLRSVARPDHGRCRSDAHAGIHVRRLQGPGWHRCWRRAATSPDWRTSA